MMLKVAKLGIALAAVLAWIVPAAYAGVPDVTQSFYVPQTGPVLTPTEGTLAIRLFRMCPNNDAGASLPNHARIKIVARDVNGNGIPNIAAADICVLFNGGTAAQGFSGIGADSVIANSTWNPICPDVRCVAADAPTDATGATYITFGGADVNNPGVYQRNPNRKWGHYDSTLPVYVLGFPISGRINSGSANGTYTLRIKSFDHTGGLAAIPNQGELVSAADFNAIANGQGLNNIVSYWRDLDTSGAVNASDFNIITQHVQHDCQYGIGQPPTLNP